MTARGSHGADDAAYSIRVVARLSGISADTLRMWERRYGFPKPVRRPNGNRVYSADDVDRLVLIARAMQAGYRPGEVVGKRRRELEMLLAETARAPAALVADTGDIAAIIQAVASEDLPSARQKLRELAVAHGARGFVVDVAGPLLDHTGLAWAAGRIEVRHEHTISELLATQIRLLFSVYEGQSGKPRVLMATLPKEQHRLGLDMAALYIATLGGDVRMLGPDTPADQIVRAARAQQVDAVGVSISANADAPASAGYLSWIAGELPQATELWVGGAGARKAAVDAPKVQRIASWHHLEQNVARLRDGR